ncbi:MAG: glycine cleavage system protein GcvH [Acidobacteria bacterium]|nr:MAG: glycine cleavage system protein GcvH [Acidobacteriota bacterium]REK10327.1 MAG: glycine cleavage system protein GcvH [Acidobacteriota bacterium]
MVPNDRRYSEEHEWVREEEDGTFVLGITEFAQDELGDVVFVELPEVGAEYGEGDEIGTIESVKAVAELYTPIACRVVEVNQKVVDTPELLNEDPHGDGWLARLEVDDPSRLDDLMDAVAYEQFTES